MRAMLVGLLGVFAILSFQFRSYVEPLTVMIAIPLALIGVIWGHLLMGVDFSMPSMLGFASLAGIVVNDSILLVLFLKAERDAGHDVLTACGQAEPTAVPRDPAHVADDHRRPAAAAGRTQPAGPGADPAGRQHRLRPDGLDRPGPVRRPLPVRDPGGLGLTTPVKEQEGALSARPAAVSSLHDSQGSCYSALIPHHPRLDLHRPAVDAARHALGLGEALPSQPRGDLGNAHAVVAVDEDRTLAVRLEFPNAGRGLAHRQQHCASMTTSSYCSWGSRQSSSRKSSPALSLALTSEQLIQVAGRAWLVLLQTNKGSLDTSLASSPVRGSRYGRRHKRCGMPRHAARRSLRGLRRPAPDNLPAADFSWFDGDIVLGQLL